jgi:hypothetical protein
MSRPPLTVVCLLVFLLAATVAFARGSMEPTEPAVSPGQIVIGYDVAATGATVQSAHALAGTLAVRNLPQIGAQRLLVPKNADIAALCAKLRKLPGVRYAEPNYRRHVLLAAPNDPAYNNLDTTIGDFLGEGSVTWFQWALHRINALQAWSVWPNTYYTSATKPVLVPNPVKVAMIDTGIDIGSGAEGLDSVPHPDFINAGGTSPDAALGGQVDLADATNVMPDYGDPSFIDDDYGHGTATAGIVAAATNNGGTVQNPDTVIPAPSPDGTAGLAYSAQVMPIKAMDATGNGTDADLAAGIVWAVDHGAVVINISAGDYYYSQAEQDAVDYAWNHGALIVAAAGNDGPSPNRVMWPAACTGVMAVAATAFDPDSGTEAPASYTNSGYYVNVCAPGGDATYTSSLSVTFWGIWSCMPTDGLTGHLGGWPTWNGAGAAPQYQYQVGTSLAAPFVAGLAALYAGKNGITQATPNGVWQMWRAIFKGCDDMTGVGGWNQTYGWGRINAYQTLMDADNRGATTGAMTGQVLYRGTPVGNGKVVATPVAGGTKRSTTSLIADGGWRIAGLAAGAYNVTAVVFGETVTVTNVQVEAGVDTPRVYLFVGTGGAPLQLVRAAYVDATHVDLFFNQAVDATTGQDPANYSINPTLAVSAATLRPDPSVVRLTIAAQTANSTYSVFVQNVQNVVGRPIAAPDNTVAWVTPGPPILSWAGTGGFVSDGVDPDKGSPVGTFTFKVKVTQPDGSRPSSVILRLWDPDGKVVAGSPFDLNEPLTPDYRVGVVFSGQVVLSTPGTYGYAFEAANASGSSRLPTTGRRGGPIVNAAPALAWTGETNYTTSGVYPHSGTPGASFTFRVKYSDPNGDPAAWVKLRLWNGSSEVPGSPFAMTNATGASTWKTGVIFTLSKTLTARGMYYYWFVANDGLAQANLPAGGVKAPWPRVDSSPVLSWAGTGGYTSAGVSPTTGATGTAFTFEVKYTDADGDAPSYVKVSVYGPGGEQISGSPFTMSPASGSDYKAGVIYSRAVSLTTVGSYTYRFTASDGLVAVGYPNPASGGLKVTP